MRRFLTPSAPRTLSVTLGPAFPLHSQLAPVRSQSSTPSSSPTSSDLTSSTSTPTSASRSSPPSHSSGSDRSRSPWSSRHSATHSSPGAQAAQKFSQSAAVDLLTRSGKGYDPDIRPPRAGRITGHDRVPLTSEGLKERVSGGAGEGDRRRVRRTILDANEAGLGDPPTRRTKRSVDAHDRATRLTTTAKRGPRDTGLPKGRSDEGMFAEFVNESEESDERLDGYTGSAPLGKSVHSCRTVQPVLSLRSMRDDGCSIGVYRDHITVSGPDTLKSSSSISSATSPPAHISYTRLCDSCPCPKCIDPSTRQKTHTSADAYRLSQEFTVAFESSDREKIRICKKGKVEGLEVCWSDTRLNEVPQDHISFYPWDLIRRLAGDKSKQVEYLTKTLCRRLWNRDTLLSSGSTNLRIPWSDLTEDVTSSTFRPRPDVLLRALEQLQVWGIVILTGVPTDETGDKQCALRKLAEAVGQLRHTFYGETWDVKSMKKSKNVAYTSLNLGLHMDLLYFANPPRFQLLHCLRNRVVGGSSYFVDSFRAAKDLHDRTRRFYKSLTTNRLMYEYDNDGHYYSHVHPVLSDSVLPIYYNLKGAVNWSPPFQAPMQLKTNSPDVERFIYKGLDEFQKLLERPEMKYEFTMNEGDMVIFDNRRVLHARTAFRDKTNDEVEKDGTVIVPSEPTRWLKGGYIDGDAVWDKLASLKFAA